MNKSSLKRITICILSLLLAICFSCCTNNSENNQEIPDDEATVTPDETPAPTEEPVREVKIVENATLHLSCVRYSTLNPLTTDNIDIQNYMKLAFEPLYEFNELKAIEPVLANTSAASADLKVWEITLEKNVQFGNEMYLTATDIVATYSYLLTNPSNYSDNVANIAGVFEKDSGTVQFVLYEPDARLTEKLTAPILYSKSIKTKIPVGTGLFYIADVSGANVMLLQNKVYRDQSKAPKITSIDISVYEKEYEKYSSDFDIGFIYEKNTAEFVMDGTKKSVSYSGNIYYSVAINTAATYKISDTTGTEVKYLTFANPCNDVNVRKAINYLVSRDEIVNTVGAGAGIISIIPAYNGTPIRHEVYDNYEYSTFLAGECLETAGYAKNEDGLWLDAQGNPLTIKILTLRSNSRLCEMMRKIRDTLSNYGITVEYESLFAEEFAERISSRNYMLVGMETELNGYNDIEKFFGASGEYNLSAWQNEKVEEYISKLKTIEDNDICNAAFAKIEETVYDECPIIGCFIASQTAIIGRNLYGVNSENFYTDNLFADFCNWYIVEDAE